MLNQLMFKTLIFFLIFNCFSAQKVENFFDSKNVIQPNKYRINIVQTNFKNESVVNFTLFYKLKNKWVQMQTGKFTKPPEVVLNVITNEDLNNDGFNDVKISFDQGARGANSIDKLFLYNPAKRKLIEIINSQDFPNLNYNEKINCINSLAYYGGTATTFLKLTKNKLVEFAQVTLEQDTLRSYKVINGKEKLLIKRKYITNDGAPFFSNYDPIDEY